MSELGTGLVFWVPEIAINRKRRKEEKEKEGSMLREDHQTQKVLVAAAIAFGHR